MKERSKKHIVLSLWQIKSHTYKCATSNLALSLLFQTLGNYETLETIENFVWHNNESMGFKMAHLKVWGLICHKDKNIDFIFIFWDFPL